MAKEFTIPARPNRVDKSFPIKNEHIHLDVDYDDVNHEETQAAALAMQEVLNKHYAEYEAIFLEHYKKLSIARYEEESKYEDFKEEYPTVEDWLKNCGL